jgi:hypothetical protein
MVFERLSPYHSLGTAVSRPPNLAASVRNNSATCRKQEPELAVGMSGVTPDTILTIAH